MTLPRAVRFVLVGIVATATYAVIVLMLSRMGVAPFWSSIGGFIISLPVSYVGQALFTYRKRTNHARYGARFILATVLMTVACSMASAFLVEQTRLGIGTTAILVSVFYPLLSYLVHTVFTFREVAVGHKN